MRKDEFPSFLSPNLEVKKSFVLRLLGRPIYFKGARKLACDGNPAVIHNGGDALRTLAREGSQLDYLGAWFKLLHYTNGLGIGGDVSNTKIEGAYCRCTANKPALAPLKWPQ